MMQSMKAMHEQMMATHQQMKALHEEEHARILAALTPAQRNMLASTIGYLALSTKPDPKAAAARLDAALSATQRASILKIASDYRAKSMSVMQAAHAKMLANLPPEMKARMEARHGQMMKPRADGAAPKRTPNAGRLLLALGRHGIGPMERMHRMHGMPGMMPRMPMMRGMMTPGMMPPGGPGGFDGPHGRMHDGAPGRTMTPAAPASPAAPAASPKP